MPFKKEYFMRSNSMALISILLAQLPFQANAATELFADAPPKSGAAADMPKAAFKRQETKNQVTGIPNLAELFKLVPGSELKIPLPGWPKPGYMKVERVIVNPDLSISLDGSIADFGTYAKAHLTIGLLGKGIKGEIDSSVGRYVIDSTNRGLTVSKFENKRWGTNDIFRPPKSEKSQDVKSEAMIVQDIPPDTGESEVDVMIVYSKKYTRTFEDGSGIDGRDSTINYLINYTNQIFKDSGIQVKLRLVKSLEIDREDLHVNDVGLALLHTLLEDEKSDIARARAQAGADLVIVLQFPFGEGENGCGGAWVMPDIRLLKPDKGFTIVSNGVSFAGTDKARYCPNEVLAHELGHVFGQYHDRITMADGGNADVKGIHPYSFGYITADGNYGDIMSYAWTNATKLFSNPNLKCVIDDKDKNKYKGDVPCFMGGEDPKTASDTARSMNITRRIIANYLPKGGTGTGTTPTPTPTPTPVPTPTPTPKPTPTPTPVPTPTPIPTPTPTPGGGAVIPTLLADNQQQLAVSIPLSGSKTITLLAGGVQGRQYTMDIASQNPYVAQPKVARWNAWSLSGTKQAWQETINAIGPGSTRISYTIKDAVDPSKAMTIWVGVTVTSTGNGTGGGGTSQGTFDPTKNYPNGTQFVIGGQTYTLMAWKSGQLMPFGTYVAPGSRCAPQKCALGSSVTMQDGVVIYWTAGSTDGGGSTGGGTGSGGSTQTIFESSRIYPNGQKLNLGGKTFTLIVLGKGRQLSDNSYFMRGSSCIPQQCTRENPATLDEGFTAYWEVR
ncbi:reprolysin-like metallopeptidase [Chitinimonas sp. PSY-7]|uniref:reprolysin-like metallopeptidase n=1 Tax=Chitinimonas sp. PSY-7 TaxID=3459088 RepID=UPI00404007FF